MAAEKSGGSLCSCIWDDHLRFSIRIYVEIIQEVSIKRVNVQGPLSNLIGRACVF